MSWSAAVTARLGGFSLSVDLTVDGTLLVIGENGAGKSTLLRALAGAIPATGRVTVGGHTLLDTAAGVCLPPQARRVGYVPQGGGLFPHLTALDNAAFGLTGPDRSDRAHAMLAGLGIADLARRRPRQLSGGQKQRVALARALVTEPALLLLDEPLAAIDVSARRALRALLAEHLAGRPAVVVTHSVRTVHSLGGEVAVLRAGGVSQFGTAAALAAAPTTDLVAEFFSPWSPG